MPEETNPSGLHKDWIPIELPSDPLYLKRMLVWERERGDKEMVVTMEKKLARLEKEAAKLKT
jgi:hypothetical protein